MNNQNNKVDESCLKLYNEFIPKTIKKRVKNKGKVEHTDENGVITTPDVISFIEYTELEDREEFIKVYVEGVNKIFDLTATAQQLLKHILIIIQDKKYINSAEVYLTYKILKECGYPLSQSSYSRALNELINKSIIYHRISNVYIYNPQYFFNGSRITFIKNYVLKEKTSC